MPYVHIICSLLAKTIGSPIYCVHLENSRAGFPDYKPPVLNDRHRGARGLRAVYELMTLAQRAKADQEDLRLREAEAGATLAGMVGGDMDTDSDDKDYMETPSLGPQFRTAAHDHEAGASGEFASESILSLTKMTCSFQREMWQFN